MEMCQKGIGDPLTMLLRILENLLGNVQIDLETFLEMSEEQWRISWKCLNSGEERLSPHFLEGFLIFLIAAE